MFDREKIIKAIEICYTPGNNCTECPFFHKEECNNDLMRDALELLKEQEPIAPKQQEETCVWTVCWNCSRHLISMWTYCPYCGRTVKWDGKTD